MKSVAIVGSGIVGTALAYHLVKAGHSVHVFENGPAIPYPHMPQFENEVLYSNRFSDSSDLVPMKLPDGVKGMSQSGDYAEIVDHERIMCVGGQATRWAGITPRMRPESFRPKTLHGFGDDWPITYTDLEPYYCKAEDYLAVSGSSDDNPFAPPRSKKFPLPPFELSYKDRELSGALLEHGLVTHTTPQARTRHDYDGRPGCQNFGVCSTCPIGARYSPNHHLNLALKTGLLTLHTNALVRRIVIEGTRARSIIYHPDHGATSKEHSADIIVVAAGGIESARLLLLSQGAGIHREGIGNTSGQVGKNLAFHHVWWGHMQFEELMMAGRAGPPTLLSHQFVVPEERRNHGGVSVELFDNHYLGQINAVKNKSWSRGDDILAALQSVRHCRGITFNAEPIPSTKKYIDLSGSNDRFGDPFVHLHYELDEFDYNTYQFSQDLLRRFSSALGAATMEVVPINQFWSAHHHLGTCRMGSSVRNSVVDSYGAVHETQGLYVCGGSTFVTATSFQPTLTMVALAIRSAEHILEKMH
ncbi:GMC family oxidoreductase [Paraburkholderia sp.]|uniref:GMC family oxidoreductase n=1 Tax=Paraburkholderia sp. TaxID=1926495 RepID=UPI003C582E7E